MINIALIKEVTTRSGILVSYWKIADWKINLSAKSLDITLIPYVNKKTRDNGYDPVRDETKKIRATDYFVKEGCSANRTDYTDNFSPTALKKAAKEGKSIYEVMYTYIKKHDEILMFAEDDV